MRYPQLLPTALALCSLPLAACGDDATGPNPVADPRPTAPQLAVASNTWLTRADMWSVERRDLATATVTNAAGQSILYAIGGRSTGGSLTKVMAYNVATNTWILRASLPMPLFAINGAGVLNGKIYIPGGIKDPYPYDPPATNTLFVFDPATNTWSQKRGMPWAGAWGVTGVIGGRLYVVTTCYEPAGPIDYYFVPCANAKFFRYNRVTDQWTTLPKPGGTYSLGGVIDGKFYVARGTSLKVFDPASNKWATKASPPGPIPEGATGTALLGRLYVTGGRRVNPETGQLEDVRTTIAYNPTTDTWATKAPLPSGRMGSSASRVVLNGQVRLELVGGSRPGNNVQYIP